MLELPIAIPELARRMLAWYRDNQRDLPWRDDPDPYRVWVSEVMLQQTQVKTVLPYYRPFLKTYPSLETLARAEESAVLEAWSGLGYYRRARNLRRAAQIVCRQHGGEFPRDYREAIRLPGIGSYSAGAILSIAYGRALPVLDGNVRRLLVRYLKLEDGSKGGEEKRLHELLTRVVEDQSVADHIGDFNQALMEIGALVCTPRKPKCPQCPLHDSCIALRHGVQESLPRPRKQPALRESHYAVALISRRKEYLLKKTGRAEFLSGFWEFPRIEGEPASEVEKAFRNVHGLDLTIKKWLAPVTHRITTRKLQFYPALVTLRGSIPREGFVWAKPGKKGFPVSAYVKKILYRLSEA